ncbi:MAG TPA: hypothetical protein VE783_04550 [Candidatus Limnocylindrales bacterium]|jgi:hypothetical protein|nr:hypothetical protein [Candidatus Limnocylindrales bacterium]
MLDQTLRPMSTSQVLDRTFYLYRRNFVLFAGIALVTPALNIVVSLLQIWWFGLPFVPDPKKMDPTAMQHVFQAYLARAAVGGLLGITVYVIGYAVSSGATAFAVSMLHLGKATTIRESYSRVKASFGRVLGLVISVFFIAVGPLILFYIAMMLVVVGIAGAAAAAGGGAGSGTTAAIIGIAVGFLIISVGVFGGIFWSFYAYCKYGLAVPACTIETLPVRYSLVRSKFLTQGSKGRLFLIYLLAGLITLGLKSVLEMPAIMSSGIFLKPGMHQSPLAFMWLLIADFFGTLLASPIAAIAMSLVYYDERVRKEAFDLQVMMENVGQAPPAESVASAAPSMG